MCVSCYLTFPPGNKDAVVPNHSLEKKAVEFSTVTKNPLKKTQQLQESAKMLPHFWVLTYKNMSSLQYSIALTSNLQMHSSNHCAISHLSICFV